MSKVLDRIARAVVFVMVLAVALSVPVLLGVAVWLAFSHTSPAPLIVLGVCALGIWAMLRTTSR